MAVLSDATSPIDQLVAGSRHTCTRHQNDELRCWGGNRNGQLGNGQSGQDAEVGHRPDDTAVRVTVDGASSVAVIDVSAGNEHTCAVLSTGGVRCWGENAHWLAFAATGQLGTGTDVQRHPGPPADMPDIELLAPR